MRNWPATNPEILDLPAAIDKLESLDPRKVRAVELRYLFGFTSAETAEVLGISKATVDRDVRRLALVATVRTGDHAKSSGRIVAAKAGQYDK